MPDNSSDLDLIRRFKAGDAAAFEEIVRAHQGRILTLCRFMLGNASDAEDAAQDVFLKAFRALGGFRPEAALGTWLYRIAVNTCIDRRRRPFLLSLFSSNEDGERANEPRSTAPSPEKLLEAREISRAIEGALARLSPKLRAAIVLKEIEDLSYEQIAEVLDVSLGTVKSRISRAREDLQKILVEGGEQKRTPLV
jgi:RNA polymerase sigma-70 factor (ECF subfamily)